jgi:hypothetical protein
MEQYSIYPVLSISLNLNNVIFYLVAAALVTLTLATTTKTTTTVVNGAIIHESLYRTI